MGVAEVKMPGNDDGGPDILPIVSALERAGLEVDPAWVSILQRKSEMSSWTLSSKTFGDGKIWVINDKVFRLLKSADAALGVDVVLWGGIVVQVFAGDVLNDCDVRTDSEPLKLVAGKLHYHDGLGGNFSQ